MNQTTPLPPPPKSDRNLPEVSGDESWAVANHERQTRGGGHRSGSRGAGTSENSEDESPPRQGPNNAGSSRHPAAASP